MPRPGNHDDDRVQLSGLLAWLVLKLESGGHLKLGQRERVKEEVRQFFLEKLG